MPTGGTVTFSQKELATVLGLLDFAWKSGAVKSPQVGVEFTVLQQKIEAELKTVSEMKK